MTDPIATIRKALRFVHVEPEHDNALNALNALEAELTTLRENAEAGPDPTVALARFFAQNWTEGHIGQAMNIIDMATRAGLVERDGMIRIELTDLGRAALALAEAP